jgi:hypothetical protein
METQCFLRGRNWIYKHNQTNLGAGDLETPRTVREESMVVSPVGLGKKCHCAGDDQQKFRSQAIRARSRLLVVFLGPRPNTELVTKFYVPLHVSHAALTMLNQNFTLMKPSQIYYQNNFQPYALSLQLNFFIPLTINSTSQFFTSFTT